MLEICKKHTGTARGWIKLGLCITVLFIAAMVFGFLALAKPYAVYANGEKVSEPWVVKVDHKELVVVESREAGEDVITGLRTEYAEGVVDQQTADIDEAVTIEKYQFEDSSTHPVVMEAPEAVAYILDINEKDQSLIHIGTTETIAEKEEIPFKTKKIETDELNKGETRVEKEGKPGLKEVVYEVNMVNGKEASRTAVKTTKIKEPVTKIVLVGTKKTEPSSSGSASTVASGSSDSSSGTSAAAPTYSSTGSAVVSYGMQFLGTPYVYGGTSLTGGIDCSGFTQAVYAKFGVYLPHSSYAQRSCGVGVSYSQARPGDLICYSGHVALYMGGGKVVHANGYGRGVQVSDATYNTIVAVRRVL